MKQMKSKLIGIGVICFVMVLCSLMIRLLVADRKQYQQEVMHSIARDFVQPQGVIGPILVLPYKAVPCGSKGKGKAKNVEYCANADDYYFSDNSDWQWHAKVDNSTYKRGIYTATAFTSTLSAQGTFNLQQDAKSLARYDWNNAKLVVLVSDLRGVMGTPIATINGQKVPLELPSSSDKATMAGYSYVAANIKNLAQGNFNYQIDLSVNGLERISTLPIGKNASVTVNTNWPNYSFIGYSSPQNRQVQPKNLKATWSANYSGVRNTQILQSCLTGEEASCESIRTVIEAYLPQYSDENYVVQSNAQAAGIRFLSPKSIYTLTDRSLKYAVLIITVTFGVFFMFEVLKGLRVHPVQYGLVGIALVVFYLLLLALSEYVSFATAYAISAFACIALIAWYVRFVLGSTKRALGLGVVLAAIYAVLYWILQSNDQTLLLGALFVFVLLTLVMFITRHINWYGVGNDTNNTQISIDDPIKLNAAPSLNQNNRVN